MSQYANTVATERSFPVPITYYQRAGTSASSSASSMPMSVSSTQAPHHQSLNNWPQYYTESPLLTPPSTFPSYIPGEGPSASTSSYASSWTSNDIPLTLHAVASGIHTANFHEAIDTHPGQVEYQASSPSLPVSDYSTSSQRTILLPSPPPQPTTFPPLYGFRNSRHGSPSSHTSTSDYGTGTKGWESPGPNAVEELHYSPSLMDVGDADESAEQITEAGSRHPSVPASTITSSSSSHPSVKLEPDDPEGCFIMELSVFPPADLVYGRSPTSNRAAYTGSILSQSLAPPTEVPLRATGASKEMRRMMGVFRLNPFAMHSLSNMDGESDDKEGLTEVEHLLWGGEGHALDEEPLMFEFQLRIEGSAGDGEDGSTNGVGGLGDSDTLHPPGLGAKEEAQLRSFSPSFELHPDDVDSGTDSRQESVPRSDPQIQGQEQGQDHDHEQDRDHDRHSESWPEADVGSPSELDTSSTTTRSVHSPLHDSPKGVQTQSPGGYEHHHNQPCTPPPSYVWDAVNERYQAVGDNHYPSSVPTTLPAMAKLGMFYEYTGTRVPRLHTTTSHPYLRRSLQNHQAMHAHSQSLPHPPAQTLSYALPHSQSSFPVLHHPTHHSQQSQVHVPHPSSNQHCQNHHFPHPHEPQQSHEPMYHNPTLTSTPAIGNAEHLAGPLSLSYMRPGRGVRGQDPEYDEQQRIYAPHDLGGYTRSSQASVFPPGSPNVHSGGQHNLAQNRRWSLPDTGGGMGQGVGGAFLSEI